MIVVDTSALMAILLGQPGGRDCAECLASHVDVAIAAGTLAECLIVAARRGVRDAMERLVEDLGLEVVATTAASARSIADAYQRWGKGVHPAGLNYGDCFAYALASERGCPLLYLGNDFGHTDVTSAIG